MHWSERINRAAGVTLLLLALAIVLSVVFSFGVTDADPFEKDEAAEALQDIDDNRAVAILEVVFDVAVSSVLGIAAAAMVYLVFRERNRPLAMLAFAFFLAESIGLFASDAMGAAIIVLADDFAEGGAGGIAAGDDTILEVARTVVLFSGAVDLMASTALGCALITLGYLIAWTPADRGVAPPTWLGWLAMVSGVLWIASWLIVATEGGLVPFMAAGIGSLVFMVVLGVWLIREPESRGGGTALPT